MIVLNKTFKKAIAPELFGGLFKTTTNTDKLFDNVPHTGALASGSSLVAASTFISSDSSSSTTELFINHVLNNLLPGIAPKNISIVTDHFLKVLDKVYTKIWNESFTETGIYSETNLATLYHGFVETDPSNFMSFKNFVARGITAGILLEEDRLVDEDQISIIGLTKANISTGIDLDNEVVSFNINIPAQLKKLLNASEGQYLFGKKLNIFLTPYQSNLGVDTGSATLNTITHTVFKDLDGKAVSTPTHKPYTTFKPKTGSSKFGSRVLLGTHLVWAIGTPDDKELALIGGTPVPDVIFDHTDKISHLDKLTLKIKFGILSI